MYLWTSWILHLQLGTSKLYLEPLLKTFETPGAFIWNPYLEPWNLPKLSLRTFAGNLDRHLEPSRTYTLTWMEPICFTWNLGIFRNLYLEPLLGTSEPSGTLYDWNPYLEPRNLPEPLLGTLTWNLGTFLLGTLTWNLGTCRNLYLEPLYLEPRNLTWNPYLEPRNLPEPLLGTLTRNLGTCRNLYLEPLLGTSEPAGTFTWNPYLEPRNLPEPLLGTLTWNLGTCRNLYLEPLLGTSEPARTWRDDCPRVPQGLVWLGPQSFQLLGKYFGKIAKNRGRVHWDMLIYGGSDYSLGSSIWSFLAMVIFLYCCAFYASGVFTVLGAELWQAKLTASVEIVCFVCCQFRGNWEYRKQMKNWSM